MSLMAVSASLTTLFIMGIIFDLFDKANLMIYWL